MCQHVRGLDFSSRAILQAKSYCAANKNISFLKSNIIDYKSCDKYDLFVCSEVLYYLSEEQIQRLIREIRTIATPNVLLVVVDKASDEYSINHLKGHFKLKDRINKDGWFLPFKLPFIKVFRPFTVYLFQI